MADGLIGRRGQRVTSRAEVENEHGSDSATVRRQLPAEKIVKGMTTKRKHVDS